MKKLDEVNKDPRFQSYMSAEEDDRKMLNSVRSKSLNDGIKIGIKQGIEEGMKHRTEDIALKMINKGLSEEEILDYLDISREDFDNIFSNK